MIGKVIGEGGFGVTYKGWDMVLQTYVAIKEYFPQFYAHRSINNSYIVPTAAQKESYEKGLRRYLEEPQNLSKFYQLSGIVSVKDFFYENGTGYIVMEYIDGINLKQYLDQSGGKIPEAKVCALMKPVLETLMEVHETGLIHRDISPDNVMVDKKNRIKLIDFGSVRCQSAADEKTYTVTLKHGYAPSEQYYAKGKQGPWTDIYSICATMYRMLTGQNPPNSIERMAKDEYVSPSYYGVNVSQKMEYVLRKGLAVNYEERYQNIKHLMQDLYFDKVVNNNQQQNVSVQANVPMQANISMQANAPVRSNVPYANTNNSYQYNQNYNIQPSTPKKKSKTWISIIIVVLVLAILIAVVTPSILNSRKSKDDDWNSAVATDDVVDDNYDDVTDEVEGNTGESVEENSLKYSDDGITVTIPEGYVYDAENSDETIYIYEKGDKALLNIFSGDAYGKSEDSMTEQIKDSLIETYGTTDWKKTEAIYNGVACTEFRGVVEDSGYEYNMVSTLCYFSDVYLVVMYVPLDDDFSDYNAVMNTVTYDK